MGGGGCGVCVEVEVVEVEVVEGKVEGGGGVVEVED